MRLFYLAPLITIAQATNIVLTNDDGWAVALVRAQNNALKAAGYSVVLSAPADNKSGTGSSTATPTTRTTACEFNSCPAGSPAYGFNASDTRLNYVNAYPADSSKYGIQTLSPKFFGGVPDLVVAGPNVGLNTGTTVNISGTVGAAVEAAREGLPAIAFSASGDSTSQVSYTTLDSAPTSALTVSAKIYANLTVNFVKAVLAKTSKPYVPAGTIINVNYPATSSCASVSAFKFVFARALADSAVTDVTTCGSSHLPSESTVVGSGCYASVSVINATNKADVGAATQKIVVDRLGSFLSCLP